jgi:hypothetical protein
MVDNLLPIVQANLSVEARVVAASLFFICSALAGYAAQFGDFTYEEHDTYIEITYYPREATGDVIIPSEIVGKPVTSIGVAAFRFCRWLTSVTIGNGVTSIGEQAFSYCNTLTSVTIPDGVTIIGKAAFSRCSGLMALTVNASNPVYSSVDGVLFDKSQTTLISFPSGRTGSYTIPESITSIGESAFLDCTNLTSVTIPDGVTGIEMAAFGDCENLTSVTIPGSVTRIGDDVFTYCTSLTAIYFKGNTPSIGSSVFSNADSVIVYFLSGMTGWGATYGDRPTKEAPNGGIPIDDLEGWFFSEWFGFYATILDPWLFHAEHGFIYRYPESRNGSTYFYDDAMGAWWWTSETIYPFIYAYNPPADNAGTDTGDAWLWYFEDSKTPRVFGVATGDDAGAFLFFGP